MKQLIIGFLMGILAVPIASLVAYWGYQLISSEIDTTEFNAYYDRGQYAARMHTELPVAGPFLGKEAFVIQNRGLILYERQPVLEIRHNTIAHVCISAANHTSSGYAPILSIGFRFNEKDQQAFLAALENSENLSMEFETGGKRLARFWKTPDGLALYDQKVTENPAGLDLEIFAEREEVMQLLYIAGRYSPAQVPDVCDDSIDPHKITYWKQLTREVWPPADEE